MAQIPFTVADGSTIANDLLLSASITQANTSAVGFTKAGAGTMTLTGTNNYTDITTINAGVLQIGAGGTAGTLGTSSVTNNGTLAFNRSDNISVSNPISGTGTLSKLGSNTLTLTGAMTYTGSTALSGGAIVFQNDARPSTSGFTGAGAVTIKSNATSFTSALNSNVYSFDTALTGLTLGSSGNTADITIGSAISIAGPITIYGGKVLVSGNLTTNTTGAITATSTSYIKVGSGVSLSAAGDITLAPASTFFVEMYGSTIQSTGAGNIKIGGDGTTNSLGSYFQSSAAQTVSSVGGSITFYGDLIIANSHANGLSISTSGSVSVTFNGKVDSGDTYQFSSQATTYANPLGGGLANTNKTWNQVINSFTNLGTNQGEVFLATPVTQLQNSLLSFGSLKTDTYDYYGRVVSRRDLFLVQFALK
jgi:autotransporter-associated beta strand protein